MAERDHASLWTMRAIFATLMVAILFFQLMPINTVPRIWAGPDLMLALTLAWVLRRPEYVPPLLVAGLFLLADLLLHRPPGLWTALVLITAEMLRARYVGLRDMTFAAEWAAIAGALVAFTLIYRSVLSLLVVDQAPLGLSLIQLIMTLAVYPIVVILSQIVFGVRKRAPGDLDTLGGRV
ncbi:MAG: rod shape-determining protein MreD [Pseudomonadota bacterium]